MPKISVIMPVYNAEKYLREAIDSILAQTFTDFEFIIIDDGSTDSSPEIVRSYADERIRFYQNEHNMGVSATLNRGLELAKGEYIARMDSDDISLPERFAKQVEYMDAHPECVVLGTSIIKFGDSLNECPVNCHHDPDYTTVMLLFHSSLIHPSVMLRGSVMRQNDLSYSERLSGVEDYELWWRLSHFGRVLSLSDLLLKYRIHPAQITQGSSSHRRELEKEFLDDRMKSFGLVLTTEESSVFLDCCEGNYNRFSQTDVRCFINILKRVKKSNHQAQVLDEKVLNKVTVDAIITCLDGSQLSKGKVTALFFHSMIKKPSVQLAKWYVARLLFRK